MPRQKNQSNRGFTLIELVIAMSLMAIIGLSLANLNSTIMEQRASATTKTYIQGVMNRFLTQLKAEVSFANSYIIDNTVADASILRLNMPVDDTRPSSTVIYTYTNNTMVRTQVITTVTNPVTTPDPLIDFTTIAKLPNYVDATIRFTCGNALTTPKTNCFEQVLSPGKGQSVKIARVTVETVTPENKKTRIVEAFGELGITATDVFIYKPTGMVVP